MTSFVLLINSNITTLVTIFNIIHLEYVCFMYAILLVQDVTMTVSITSQVPELTETTKYQYIDGHFYYVLFLHFFPFNFFRGDVLGHSTILLL